MTASPSGRELAPDGDLPLLDTVRGLAACAVVAFHVATHFGVADGPGLLRQLTGRLDVSVWVFFVLSGFLLYRPFVAATLDGGRSATAASYARRRFLRIAPGYWVALTVTTLWLGQPRVFTWPDAPRQFLLIKNFWNDSYPYGLGQAWSLCVEAEFYVLLPLYAVLARTLPLRRRARPMFEVALLGLVIAASIWYKWHAMSTPGTNGARFVWWYLDAFGVGMVLAVLHADSARRPRAPAWLRGVDRRPGLVTAAALATYLYVALGMGLNGDYRQPLDRTQIVQRHLAYTLIGALLLVPAAFGRPGHGFVRRIAGWRALVFLGKISYGIYLYQVLGLVLADRWGIRDEEILGQRYFTWLFAVLGLTIAMATVSWYGVERPALRLKTRLRRHEDTPLRQQSAPAAV